MDLFKSQFERIQQQLAGLTPSQKMLSAALVTIMVMTLWLSGRYAAAPEMEPLLNQQLSQDDVARIGMQLQAAGIEHKMSPDGKMLVPADRRIQAIANLGYANLMPKDFSNGFDQIITKLTAWDGNDRQNAMFNRGKEMTLEQMISNFPGVAQAKVVIDPRSVRRIGQGDLEPSATVSVTMRDGGQGNKQLAKAVTHFVSGAHSGLKVGAIKLVIGTQLYTIQPDGESIDGLSGDTVAEIQFRAEKALVEKIKELTGNADVRVAVTMKVNNAVQAVEETKYNKDTSLIAEQQSETTTRENSQKVGGAAEAGAVPNTGQSIAAAAGGTDRAENDERSRTTNFIGAGVRKETSRTPAGAATPLGVTVRFPRSWLVAVAKANLTGGKDPDAAAIAQVADAELGEVRKHVYAITGLTDEKAIHIGSYFDLVAPPAAAEPQLAGVAGITGMVRGSVKEIALGGLAVVSLIMMSMMVRKGSPLPAPAPAAPAARSPFPNLVGSMEALVGEVSTQDPTLDGMELDDDAIRTQQMLSQVTSLVGENPDSAAQLVKRWMNQR